MSKQTRNSRKDYSLKKRFLYWFDNHMSNGSLSLIRVLITASILLALLIAVVIIICRFQEEGGNGSVLWNSVATLINAEMPSYEDGSIGYVLMMALVAIAGVLFTSVLIGFFTSAIEEKIDDLKKGNSLVVEKDHIVVLGFLPGEYTLIHQLVLAAEDEPGVLVVADDLEREKMEELILENVETPRTFRIVCRTVDITDPVSIEKCSIENCRTVIISPIDDTRTIKATLAVSALMKKKCIEDIRINAIISKEMYRLPLSVADANNITTFQTNEILAKMIAHSCTQKGLSETFREIFNFEGSEFYLVDLPQAEGHTFEELMLSMDKAVPSGVLHRKQMMLNPPADYRIEEEDRILVFAENGKAAVLNSFEPIPAEEERTVNLINADMETDVVIIGKNETLPIILQELPENVTHAYLIGQNLTDEESDRLTGIMIRRNMPVTVQDYDPRSLSDLTVIAKTAEHIVVLNDHEKEEDLADMESIFTLMNLRDIRAKYNLSFNMTFEMRKEHNEKLVENWDHTDFLVSSSMSSLILAQLAENPELIDVFRELLSNEGNEVYLKSAEKAGLIGEYSVRDLRHMILRQGYIMLGHMNDGKESVFNMDIGETITLNPGDYLIVLGLN